LILASTLGEKFDLVAAPPKVEISTFALGEICSLIEFTRRNGFRYESTILYVFVSVGE
jgi:hypothetical protein